MAITAIVIRSSISENLHMHRNVFITIQPSLFLLFRDMIFPFFKLYWILRQRQDIFFREKFIFLMKKFMFF